jgi:HPt (histidine-containing phosphotransfer) domain-containing protein
METANNKNIDLSYLKQLSNGSNEFICEMISVFMEQTPKELDEIDKYWDAKDWQSLHRIAHKMKPSFTFMGIKELENVIYLINEYSSTETNIDQLPELISKLKNVCFEALEELEIEKQLFL